jgi:hypothetical protein
MNDTEAIVKVNLLLRDFARELLKQRLLRLRVKFVRLIELSRPE